MPTTKQILLDAIRANPGATRKELLALTDLPGSKADPARMRMWLAGEIEPNSDEGWKAAFDRDFEQVGWQFVEDSAQQTAVAERAAERKPRNAAKSAEEKAREIVAGLEDGVVNRLVQEMMKDGAGSAKAQRRADQTLRKKQTQRRQEAKQAERDKTADEEFKRVLKQLWDARGAVAAIDTHLIEERARVAAGEPRRIPNWDWVVALSDVRTIIKSLGSMWQNVRDLEGQNEPCPACGASTHGADRHLQPFVIDVEAVEEGEEIIDAEIVS